MKKPRVGEGVAEMLGGRHAGQPSTMVRKLRDGTARGAVKQLHGLKSRGFPQHRGEAAMVVARLAGIPRHELSHSERREFVYHPAGLIRVARDRLGETCLVEKLALGLTDHEDALHHVHVAVQGLRGLPQRLASSSVQWKVYLHDS